MSLHSVQESVRRASHGAASASSSSYDLVIVGFGTTALSLATSLADRETDSNILFIERQNTFSWQPAHILPENPVRTSFLRDLITTRNPRSEFTFVNYLYETDQLVQFTNSSHIAPSRMVMGNYLSWVASRITERGWVRYGTQVVRVSPVKSNNQQVTSWAVETRDSKGATSIIYSKRVALATGSKPHIPSELASAQSAGKVLHSSAVAPLLENLKDQDVAIVGADQESAEIFEHLQSAGALHRVRATMFVPDSALRPEDNTSFIQDIVDDRSPTVASTNLPPEVRSRFLSTDAASPHPRIALSTIENLYEMQYAQRISHPNSRDWRFQVEILSQIVSTQPEGAKLRLVTKNPRTGEIKVSDRAFDLVIAAGGREQNVSSLLDNIEASGLLEDKSVTVDRDYKVIFRREVLQPGCALWMLGSLEENRIRDDAFTYMAERGERLVSSVVEAMSKEQNAETRFGELAML